MGRGGIHLGTEYGNQTMKKDLGMNVSGPASLAMRGLRGISVRHEGGGTRKRQPESCTMMGRVGWWWRKGGGTRKGEPESCTGGRGEGEGGGLWI